MIKRIDSVKECFKEQIEALNSIIPVLENAFNAGVPRDAIVFGGGTALSIYYFQHRMSFDIDFFVKDPQYFSLLSPKLWIDDLDGFYKKYIDLFHHIGITTHKNIKIDFLLSNFINPPMKDFSKMIFSTNIFIHSIEDIIANKIIFRKKDNKTRDIFDIAVALENNSNIFTSLLEKEVISIDDLRELYQTLEKLDKEKYINEIKLIEPVENFKEISINAFEIINNNIEKMNVFKNLEDNKHYYKK